MLDSGLQPEQLTFYGLEYKYLTLFISGEISYDEMFSKLNIAIHQFAKRQMTWFRKMEKNGIFIHWINGELSLNEKVAQLISLLPEHNLIVSFVFQHRDKPERTEFFLFNFTTSRFF